MRIDSNSTHGTSGEHPGAKEVANSVKGKIQAAEVIGAIFKNQPGTHEYDNSFTSQTSDKTNDAWNRFVA